MVNANNQKQFIKTSFDDIEKYWINEVESYAEKGVQLLLIGNKSDLEQEKQVDSSIALVKHILLGTFQGICKTKKYDILRNKCKNGKSYNRSLCCSLQKAYANKVKIVFMWTMSRDVTPKQTNKTTNQPQMQNFQRQQLQVGKQDNKSTGGGKCC